MHWFKRLFTPKAQPDPTRFGYVIINRAVVRVLVDKGDGKRSLANDYWFCHEANRCVKEGHELFDTPRQALESEMRVTEVNIERLRWYLVALEEMLFQETSTQFDGDNSPDSTTPVV